MGLEEMYRFSIDFGIDVVEINKVQARTHKKRRVNKKWLKRYGYRYELFINGKLVDRNTNVRRQSTRADCYPYPSYLLKDFNFSDNLS